MTIDSNVDPDTPGVYRVIYTYTNEINGRERSASVAMAVVVE